MVCVTNTADEQWWFGYLHRDAGLSGHFPAGFVTPYEDQPAAPDAAEAAEPAAAAAEAEGSGAALYAAIADYDPEGQDGCMALAAGDLVVLTDASDEQWWFGHQLTDASVAGAFPAAFVAPHTADEEASEQAEGGVVDMEVECPDGVEAGMMIVLTTPDGTEVEVAVPEGVGPGDIFIVPVGCTDAAAATDKSDEVVDESDEVVDESATTDVAERDEEAEEAEAAEETDAANAAASSPQLPLHVADASDGLELEPVKGRYKLVLLGGAKAGKSALYRSLIGTDGFNPEYAPTLGLEHQKVRIEAHHFGHFRKEMTVEVWDRGGAAQYGAVSSAFWKKTSAALLVFDRTSRESFDALGEYLGAIHRCWRLLTARCAAC